MPECGGFSFLIDDSEAGERLDIVVATRLPGCSRSLAADLIRSGKIRVCGIVKKAGYRVRARDQVRGRIPPPEPIRFSPEAIPLNILYEDSHLVILNKEAGRVVHPGPGHPGGTLVNGLLYHCPDLKGVGGALRPGIVHRLDKDTSGTLVVAKTAQAHAHLSAQFKNRTVEKTYRALVYGNVKAAAGSVDKPVGRHPTERKRMAADSPTGRSALTLYRVAERYPGATLLDIEIKTGRTHQIRVHCAAIGHPVVGDAVYSGRSARKKGLKAAAQKSPAARCLIDLAVRQMLHSWRLKLMHPISCQPLYCESPLPPDMEAILNCLRASPN